jgi:DNA polymerase-1
VSGHEGEPPLRAAPVEGALVENVAPGQRPGFFDGDIGDICDVSRGAVRLIFGGRRVDLLVGEARSLAKALNFGVVFGMGVAAFRESASTKYGVTLTEDQARAYREAFLDAYPGLRRWHRTQGDGAVDTRTLAGRRRAGVTRFTDKLNSPVQGTEADGLKLALSLLWQRRELVPGAFPVLVVHDEIVVEADEAQADTAAAWLKQAMIDGMAPLIEPVPVEVDVTVARTWAGETE